MKLKIYGIYDSAAAAYLPPFFTHNEQLATRSFIDSANNPESTFGRHPADFTLFELGNFDDQAGEFELNHAPIRIANALELLSHQAQQTELFNEVSNDTQLSGSPTGDDSAK